MATAFSLLETLLMSLNPMPPQPMDATLSFSEGGFSPVWDWPRTCRGTMAMPVARAEAERNRRRVGGGIGGVIVSSSRKCTAVNTAVWPLRLGTDGRVEPVEWIRRAGQSGCAEF